MLQRTSWPQKTRELHNHHMDSTVWNAFRFRADDIIIGTYAKSGTTWTQQIISQLIFGGAEGIDVPGLSPWLDMRIMPRAEMLAGLEAQTHRRFIKTHLPVDALVFSPGAKYVYIVRDGRDVAWSLHNHLYYGTDEFYRLINDTPGRVGPALERPPADIRRFFLDWLERDGYPLWSFWENIRTWWNIRHLPNVMLLHFADLKADPAGKIRELAEFLDIAVADDAWPRILEHCSFDYMKRNADKSAPLGGMLWEGGAGRFINKGTNGRWRDVLTDADNRRYRQLSIEQLGADCATWLERGGRA
ncbi:sulfotransferase domain-containing protein [Sphingomonas sp. MAH-20]|uniref:Sulfotransferase domain-containing protein n=1 Tax=Sphingomonas horti TaxID=2682842 RepID=A0A6I4J1J2_9SPHN|nr:MULTISPECIES: sulfotransferase domain-containing protein [Sphingomonas]MBA2920058.1 sulfotransferase domain-containing protein [Sphingomonas sp. CGMCC 1.13658]MVO77938.1 sulfotransferase domain-containing protein [Sphingomonas horti]